MLLQLCICTRAAIIESRIDREVHRIRILFLHCFLVVLSFLCSLFDALSADARLRRLVVSFSTIYLYVCVCIYIDICVFVSVNAHPMEICPCVREKKKNKSATYITTNNFCIPLIYHRIHTLNTLISYASLCLCLKFLLTSLNV